MAGTRKALYAPKVSVSTAPLTAEAAGERRYLTMMFCDLDSTGIAARLEIIDDTGFPKQGRHSYQRSRQPSLPQGCRAGA
jgi:SRSO17 transposase